MYDEFAGFLTTKIHEARETNHRLSEKTGIPERALDQLTEGDPTNLPAAPYIHGYIVKLGEELDFDGEAWWQQLKRSEPAMSSGIADRMPRNRFSRNRIPGWVLWGVPLFLGILTFLAFRFSAIIGLPDVAITTPDRDGIVMTTSPTRLAGTATPGSRVTINGEAIPLTNEGTWEKDVNLQPGAQNDFTVEVTKFLGRSRSSSRRIFFEPPIVTTTSTVMTSSTDPNASTTPPIFESRESITDTPTTTIVTF